MERQRNYFGTTDYVLFSLTLIVSSSIGVFFAYKQRHITSSVEYLVAGRSLGWFPLFVSLSATFMSAIGVMGLPSQIYTTGITFSLYFTSCIIPILLCVTVFGPIFRKLQLVSVNEYLEKRYSIEIRFLGCALFYLQYLLYLSIALYTPSLALESVAGVPQYITIISTGIVCTFYTTLGGMRAVIWTDVFQSAVMIVGLITTAIVGALKVGSLSEVFDKAYERERLTFNFSFDPRQPHTVWGIFIGLTFSNLVTWTVSQPTIQRVAAAKTLKAANKSLIVCLFWLIFLYAVLTFDALIIYAVYSECDLIMSNKISRNDQILPYFVVDTLGHLTGMPGLFTACLFSFALSTLSSGLNSMSALFLEDVVKKVKPRITDKAATNISKVTAFLWGIFITGFAFVVPYLDSFVVKLTIQLFGIIGGPYFSIFALGVFSKKSNKYGAYASVFVGLCVGFFLSVGQIMYPPEQYLPPVSVRECSFFNATTSNSSGIIHPKGPTYGSNFANIFSISYVWFGMIGTLCSLLAVEEQQVNENLIYKLNLEKIYCQIKGKKSTRKYKVENKYELENVGLKSKTDTR